SRGYGAIVLNPRYMRNCWYAYWQKEVGAQTSSFGIFPSEGFFLLGDHVDQYVDFVASEEPSVVVADQFRLSLAGESLCRDERWRVWVKRRNGR
ncbi:hypothetical protein C0989_012371, partial [Termitomyces sp. Mn162]